MRHAPTAPSRLRRAVVLASLLLSLALSLWCAVQPPAALAASATRARTPGPSAPAREAPAATVHADEAEDHSSALAPILVGLLLTGIASYKHRGLPRGH